MLAYSAAAGLAFAAAPDADAQVTYVDVDPDEMIAGTGAGPGAGFFLDIDGDGTDDLRFIQTTYATYGSAPRPIAAIYAVDLGTGFQGYTGPFFNYANAEDAGTTIDGSAIVGAGGTAPGLGVLGTTYGVYGPYGPWAGAGQTDKYVGVQFVAGGGTVHYAWLRLDVAPSSGTITLKDYAFEATPLTPIAAGDMGGAPPPPPPGTLATFDGDTTGGPTWDRPFTVGDGTSGSCSISGTGAGVTYQTFEMTTDTDGEYVVGITTAAAGFDTYLLLYEGSFNPADQCVDLIALDDDDGSTSASTIGAGVWSGRDPLTLDDAETYTIVVSGFSGTGDDFGAFDGFVEGPAGAMVTIGGAPPPPDDDPDFRAINLNGTTVPSSGGTIRYKFEIDNTMNADDEEVDIWATVADATGTNVIYVRNPRTFMVDAGTRIRKGYNQRIPDYVPDGTYIYTILAGDFDEMDPSMSDVYGMEVFSVTKGATLAGGITMDQFKGLAEQNGAAWTEAFVQRIPEITPVPNAKEWQESSVTDLDSQILTSARSSDAATTVIGRKKAAESADLTQDQAPAIQAQVAPNPVTDAASFLIEVEEAAQVSLVVFDALGRQVAQVADGVMEQGSHTVTFDATAIPAGTYVYRLAVGSSVQSGRFTVVR